MPKLYEYFGITIFFYANEHEPVHVHGKYQGFESKAEIILVDGNVAQINLLGVEGRAPLPPAQRKLFIEIVHAKANEIVKKWISFFVLHKQIVPRKISRKLNEK